jgi:hypothetical protein
MRPIGTTPTSVARRSAGWLALAVAVVLAVSGCGAPEGSPIAASLVPDPIRQAIEFRISMGLRSDEAYVRWLAGDPGAVANGHLTGIGVPILDQEIAELQRRASASDRIAPRIRAYGETQPRNGLACIWITRVAGSSSRCSPDTSPNTERAWSSDSDRTRCSGCERSGGH